MGFIRLGNGDSGAVKVDGELEDSGRRLGSRSAGGGKLSLPGSLVRRFLQVGAGVGVAFRVHGRTLAYRVLGSGHVVVLMRLML